MKESFEKIVEHKGINQPENFTLSGVDSLDKLSSLSESVREDFPGLHKELKVLLGFMEEKMPEDLHVAKKERINLMERFGNSWRNYFVLTKKEWGRRSNFKERSGKKALNMLSLPFRGVLKSTDNLTIGLYKNTRDYGKQVSQVKEVAKVIAEENKKFHLDLSLWNKLINNESLQVAAWFLTLTGNYVVSPGIDLFNLGRVLKLPPITFPVGAVLFTVAIIPIGAGLTLGAIGKSITHLRNRAIIQALKSDVLNLVNAKREEYYVEQKLPYQKLGLDSFNDNRALDYTLGTVNIMRQDALKGFSSLLSEIETPEAPRSRIQIKIQTKIQELEEVEKTIAQLMEKFSIMRDARVRSTQALTSTTGNVAQVGLGYNLAGTIKCHQ